MPFTCSICGEESTRICVRCTKDACDNHLCEKCRKCSDCCECEVALTPHPAESVREALHGTPPASEPAVEVPVEAVEVAPLDVVEAMAVAPIDTIESLGMAADAGALGDEEAGDEPEEHEPEAAKLESHEPEDSGSEEPPVV